MKVHVDAFIHIIHTLHDGGAIIELDTRWVTPIF
jgi:hypothetical protein